MLFALRGASLKQNLTKEVHKMAYLSDIEIAQSVQMKPITEIAKTL